MEGASGAGRRRSARSKIQTVPLTDRTHLKEREHIGSGTKQSDSGGERRDIDQMAGALGEERARFIRVTYSFSVFLS